MFIVQCIFCLFKDRLLYIVFIFVPLASIVQGCYGVAAPHCLLYSILYIKWWPLSIFDIIFYLNFHITIIVRNLTCFVVTFVYIIFSLWGFIDFNSMYVSNSLRINNLQKPARLSGSITVNARILLGIPSFLSAFLWHFIPEDQTISLHFQLGWPVSLDFFPW